MTMVKQLVVQAEEPGQNELDESRLIFFMNIGNIWTSTFVFTSYVNLTLVILIVFALLAFYPIPLSDVHQIAVPY